jgi:hypothetical protein
MKIIVNTLMKINKIIQFVLFYKFSMLSITFGAGTEAVSRCGSGATKMMRLRNTDKE